MKKKLQGHLVNFEDAQEMLDYGDHIWRGGAMSEQEYDAYKDTPSKKECDKLCAELSGEVVTYKIKKPRD